MELSVPALICSVLSKGQRMGTHIMCWEDFPEAVNNVPEAEDKPRMDPNLALTNSSKILLISDKNIKLLLS